MGILYSLLAIIETPNTQTWTYSEFEGQTECIIGKRRSEDRFIMDSKQKRQEIYGSYWVPELLLSHSIWCLALFPIIQYKYGHQSSFKLRRLVGFLSQISLEAYACSDRMFVSRQKLAFTVYRWYDEYMKLEKNKSAYYLQ